MKSLIVIIWILLVSHCFLFGQNYESHSRPGLFVPTTHDMQLANTMIDGPSFYSQKEKWQDIIDTTWGPGLPLEQKQDIFNTFVKHLDDKFPSFPFSKSDWDSIKNHYYTQIDSSTSRGRFSAIMSHIAFNLKEMHTSAWDKEVVYTALNPGVPLLLVGGYNDIRHFGAVLTPLPDSSLLVLRAVENHPLNLQPGDIVLGYEGVPWKNIVKELLEAELPLAGYSAGSESAFTSAKLITAGMNWHLFETIDIKKISGEIQNLPTSSLISLDVEGYMFNNEQLEITNIPFPPGFIPMPYEGFLTCPTINYGILNNSNIGFIYIYAENFYGITDGEFYEAVNSLKHTDGLIIDLRYNEGGLSFFYNAFNILFNCDINTTEYVYRCDQTTWNLCQMGTEGSFKISADPNTFYERPITVLLGPNCVSMGGITAYRLGYHPNVKFFGKSINGSLSDNEKDTTKNNWELNYAIADMQHFSNPGHYLNQEEFPIDFPVWFKPEDVVNGYDAVVEEAKKYINNLPLSHNAQIDKRYSFDNITFRADVINPNSHDIRIIAQVENISEVLDSIPCTITNEMIENTVDLSLYPEDLYSISILTEDLEDSTSHKLPNILRFTNAGPVKIENYNITQLDNRFRISDLEIINNSQKFIIPSVSIDISCEDTSVNSISILGGNTFGDVGPQEIKGKRGSCYIDVDTMKNYTLVVEISSDYVVYWKDTIECEYVPVDVKLVDNLPTEYSLAQNYPNPFNPVTTIKYSIPTDLRYEYQDVRLIVHDILGREVATLVNENQKPGNYEIEFDGTELTSGIYFYRIKVGEFVETKKMILLK